MQLDSQVALRLMEQCHTIACFDIEATGLRGDYNSILCVSIKPYGKPPHTYAVKKAGEDREVVEAAIQDLSQYDCWVSYYGKGFDFPMINTRALCGGLPPLARKPHIDMYYTLKSHLLTARRSQAHLLDWLNTPEKKMSVSANMWNKVLANIGQAMPVMIKRCESDTRGLEALYKRTRHLIKDVKA